MATRNSITVQAFAKINLDLRVVGVRPDGYHELRTTFQSIALADVLTFTRTRGPFRIECDDPACPTDSSNLIWKAAELVVKMARRRGALFGVTVRLEKNIPMQAGLGGGSSDAAAALRALSRLWRVKVSPAQLNHAAASLGADVPVFSRGRDGPRFSSRRSAFSTRRHFPLVGGRRGARVRRQHQGRLRLVG